MNAARVAVLGGYFGLLGLWLAWSTLFAPSRHATTALVLGVSTLPLLIPLRGVLYDNRGSFIWLGLASIFYFIHGVGEFTDFSQRLPAGFEIAFSLCLFWGSLARLRRK